MAKNRRKSHFTTVKKHKRVGSVLSTTLSSINPVMIEWERDLMPEHLWIDLLAQECRNVPWVDVYNEFLDRVDAVIDYKKQTPFLGLISDFAMITEEQKKRFLEINKDYAYEYFYKVVGESLSLYPACPANWLILDEWKNKKSINFEYELNKLSLALTRLFKAKDLYTGHLRAVPLNRLFKHDRLRINREKFTSLIELLKKYPGSCNEEEKYHVQQFARTTMNQIFMTTERYSEREWSKYFWRHNYSLTPCKPAPSIFKKGDIEKDDEIMILQQKLLVNSNILVNYINKIGMQYKYDLYEPTYDEIKIGLFSRIIKLFVTYTSDPLLWTRDMSGIMLRCLGETAIVFSYLVTKGSLEEIDNFKKYSLGKEKLLMLHMQDTLQQKKTLGGETIEDITGELGGEFRAEMQNIELKNWTKKTIRELSEEVGFDDIYKWVIDPSSAELHGSWSSIKKSNLAICAQIMHRYHLVPYYYDSPIYLVPLHVATQIYLKVQELAISVLQCPKPDEQLKEIPEITSAVQRAVE